jgi:hypothetical protein
VWHFCPSALILTLEEDGNQKWWAGANIK